MNKTQLFNNSIKYINSLSTYLKENNNLFLPGEILFSIEILTILRN